MDELEKVIAKYYPYDGQDFCVQRLAQEIRDAGFVKDDEDCASTCQEIALLKGQLKHLCYAPMYWGELSEYLFQHIHNGYVRHFNSDDVNDEREIVHRIIGLIKKFCPTPKRKRIEPIEIGRVAGFNTIVAIVEKQREIIGRLTEAE